MADYWGVYIVECADGTLYTGVTKWLVKRLERHNAGKGAKYTRGRTPVVLVAYVGGMTRSEALRLERLVKRQPKAKKVDFLKEFKSWSMV